MLDQLPTEILLDIGSRLFLEDIASLSTVNHDFYTIFNPLLYQEDSKPYRMYSIYWAAEHASLTIAQKALSAGASVNSRVNPPRYYDRDNLRYREWYNNPHTDTSASAPVDIRRRVDIHGDLTDFVELLLQAGADMTMLYNDTGSRSFQTTILDFLSTPLGRALLSVNRSYFEVVLGHYVEVGLKGSFSPLTRAKLAIVGGHLSLLEEVLSLHAVTLDLKGPTGQELHRLAYKEDRHDMCRCLYFWMYGKPAKANYMCDSSGRFRNYILQCAEDAIEAGGSCAYIKYEDEWSKFRSIRNMYKAFECCIDDLGRYRRAATLTDVAICIRDRQLLEFAISLESATMQNRATGQLRLLQCACSWGDTAWAESILDEGLDLSLGHGAEIFEEILYDIIRKGHIDCLRLLLRRGPPISDIPAQEERRSLIAEAITHCGEVTSVVSMLNQLLTAGADTTHVYADLEKWYSHPSGYWKKGIILRTLCQPGCMELLEQYGICVYRPHELYLLNACQQHNYPLVQRLLNDRVLRPDFLHEAHTTGLLPRNSNPYREPKGHSVRQTILHRFCQNLFYNPEYAADDVKILQALLTQPVRVNAEKYNRSLLQYSCMNLVRSHSHAEAMISCLISHGADVKKLERDMSFTLPANLDLNARSRYLLDVTKSVVAVIDRPIAWLMAICRSEKPEARKLVQRYMAENPKSQMDRGLIGAAMRQACTADNVGALETLLGYTYDPLAFLSTAASEYPAQGRVVEYLKAMGIDYSKGTPLRG